LDLNPVNYDFAAAPPVLPGPDGLYKIATPGITKYA